MCRNPKSIPTSTTAVTPHDFYRKGRLPRRPFYLDLSVFGSPCPLCYVFPLWGLISDVVQERYMKRILAASFLAATCTTFASAQSCESLSKLSLPQAKILSAETIPAGAFKLPVELPPFLADGAGVFKSLPAFCRVVVQATPSADSDIRIEVWLPAENWNGKFQAHGDGGFAGYIDYAHLATSILGGYASA